MGTSSKALNASTSPQPSASQRRTQVMKKKVPSKEANKYIKQLKMHLLQPSRKHYGGMGYAKESVFLQLDDAEFSDKFEDIWDEHIPGFSGKSFKKRKSASDETMLWKQRLQAKQAQEKSKPASKSPEGTIHPQTAPPHASADGKPNSSNRPKACPDDMSGRQQQGLQHVAGKGGKAVQKHLNQPSQSPLEAGHVKQNKLKQQQDTPGVMSQLQAQAIAAYRAMKKARHSKVRATT